MLYNRQQIICQIELARKLNLKPSPGRAFDAWILKNNKLIGILLFPKLPINDNCLPIRKKTLDQSSKFRRHHFALNGNVASDLSLVIIAIENNNISYSVITRISFPISTIEKDHYYLIPTDTFMSINP